MKILALDGLHERLNQFCITGASPGIAQPQ
jgi:hypothetical protein